MTYLLYVLITIIAGTIGFVAGRKTKRSFSASSPEELSEMRSEAKEALSERTEERKEKILEFLTREIEHQKEVAACTVGETVKGITRNDIEVLLGVSDTTARKYLNELESEQKIRQVGDAGQGVYYVPIGLNL